MRLTALKELNMVKKADRAVPELMKGIEYSKVAATKKGVPAVLAAEIKHDEIRCHVVLQDGVIKFLSYAGKPLHNLARFAELFADLLKRYHFTELDCGVEVNENFNDSYRYVRSSSGIPNDLVDARVRFHIFDTPDMVDAPYIYRFFVRRAMALWLTARGVDSPQPTHQLLYTHEAHQAAFEEAVAQGYEGLMLKTLDHKYARGRTKDWIKMKPLEPADGEVTAINQCFSDDGTPAVWVDAEGVEHHYAGSVHVKLEDGSVACPGGFKRAIAVDMWAHPEKYIGQWLEFVYMERDRKGGYRHPRFKRWREDK
jgi:ATP-dependent DNA ligase